MFEHADDALDYVSREGVEFVDLKIATVAGRWLHVTIPADRVGPWLFERGVGYDGSSGSGFGRVESGDVVAVPDPATGFEDPFPVRRTVCFLCDTVSASTREPSPMDPRTIAKRAEAFLRESGVADEALFAPEFEFHVFDRVNVVNDPTMTMVRIESAESEGDRPSIPAQLGYMRSTPADRLGDLRDEIAATLGDLGVPVKYHHHEVGASGQCEIETELAPLVLAADRAQIIKHVAKNVAAEHGLIATFMPKPVFGEAGNGLHVHQRLGLNGSNVFHDTAGRNDAGLSDLALHYTAGLLTHGQSMTGLTNPSTNSFKRLVEGYEAPVKLFFSLGNRSAAVRVPGYANGPDDTRIEYRPPDSTGNIYLTLSAMLMAGLDGIENKIDPAKHNLGPYNVDIAAQDEAFKSRIASLPASLEAALASLEADHDYLTDVFTPAFIEAWIAMKRRAEVRVLAARPHPYEFVMYLDA